MPTNTPVAEPASRSGRQPGVLQRLPRDLEQQPLLRVHGQRLARRDAEERRVEAVDAVEEAAVRADISPGASGSGSK